MNRLLVRVLAASFLLVLATAGATAWLTLRGTFAAIDRQAELAGTADIDAYTTLTEWAVQHPTWAGVPVADIAAASGRRVALVRDDGRVIADSHPGAPLPGTDTAELDPFTPDPRLLPEGYAPWQHMYDPHGFTEEGVEAVRAASGATARCYERRGPEARVHEGPGLPLVIVSELLPLTACPGVGGAAPSFTPAYRGIVAHANLADHGFEGRVRADGVILIAAETGSTTPGPLLDDVLREGAESWTRSLLPEPVQVVLGPVPGAAAVPFWVPWDLVAALTAVAALAIGVSLVLSWLVVSPVTALTGAVRRMSDGDRSARVHLRGRPGAELAMLGDAFNAMSARLEKLESERRARLGEVSHELRTPLTNLRGWLEAAREGITDLDPDLLDALVAETRQLHRVADDLHQLALADDGRLALDRHPVPLPPLLAQVAAAHGPAATARDVTIDVDTDPLTADVDAGRLRQALGNLVANALRHTPRGGTVALAARPGPGGVVVLTVRDDGPGVPAEHLPHLFDRFWRAPGATPGEGSGLGLAVVRSVAAAHSGTVTADSPPSGGLTVTLTIPPSPVP